MSRFGLVPVRSPLLRESRLMYVPPGTEMFQFPDWPLTMESPGMTQVGLPHSDIGGSTLASSSPPLIAANHVLHRPLTPRHPPCTLHTFYLLLCIRVHAPQGRGRCPRCSSS